MIQNSKLIIIGMIVFICGFNAKPCMAKEFDVDLFGFSYHFDKAGAFKQAPNRLDHSGLWVFNPGVGLGYDFRRDIHTGGLSAIVNGGFFQNCANSPFFYVGAGGKYRKFLYKKLFVEANAMAIVTVGNDWDDKTYRLALMPFANLGVGYDFGKFLTTLSVGFIPKGAGGRITNGTDMLFMNMSVSF